MHIRAISYPDQVDVPTKMKDAPAAKLISIKQRVGYQEADAYKTRW